MDLAEFNLLQGRKYPYDSVSPYRDGWKDEAEASLKRHWSEQAALGVLADLRDRRGIGDAVESDEIDMDVRREIVKSLAAVIQLAALGRPI